MTILYGHGPDVLTSQWTGPFVEPPDEQIMKNIQACIECLKQSIRDAQEFRERYKITGELLNRQKALEADIVYLIEHVPAGIDHQIDSAEEQVIVDKQRRDQAAKIIGTPVSLEQATDFAINWCATAMQETCNADYWKERAQAAERLLATKGKGP